MHRDSKAWALEERAETWGVIDFNAVSVSQSRANHSRLPNKMTKCIYIYANDTQYLNNGMQLFEL